MGVGLYVTLLHVLGTVFLLLGSLCLVLLYLDMPCLVDFPDSSGLFIKKTKKKWN